jgi:hypothetical protein
MTSELYVGLTTNALHNARAGGFSSKLTAAVISYG